jgi:hypothetical protein
MIPTDTSLVEKTIRTNLLAGNCRNGQNALLQAIAAFLKTSEPGSVIFYGCGELAAKLVDRHRQTVNSAGARFITSFESDSSEFKGIPRHGLPWLKNNCPKTVVLLSREYEQEMRSNLEGMSVSILGLKDLIGHNEQDWQDYLESTLREKYADLLSDLRKLSPRKPFLMLTSQSFCHNHVRLMRHLSQYFAVIVLVNDEHLNRTVALSNYKDRGCFKRLYIQTNYREYLETLLVFGRFGPFKLIHHLNMAGSPLPCAISILFSRKPVFVEYCDFKEIMFDRKELLKKHMGLSDEDLAIEAQCLRLIFNRGAGIVLKDDPRVIDRLAKQYQRRPNWLYFNYYPSNRLDSSDNKRVRLPLKKRKPRIVYIGSLHNDPAYHCYPIHRSIYKVARVLTARGIQFSVYNGLDSNGEGFEDYLDLADGNSLFQYNFAIPEEEVAAVVGQFDFGWFVHDYSQAVEAEFFIQTTFPTRIFYYLEAGLPVIVGKNQTFLRKFVEEERIGMAIDFNQISEIDHILEQTDLPKLSAGVRSAQLKYQMQNQLPRLLEFYEGKADRSAA